MIKESTVFILGAGAHCPYKMPDGNRLTKMIVSELPPSLNADTPLTEIVTRLIIGVPKLRHTLVDLRHRLDRSGHGTLDSFLVTYANKPHYAEIGKIAVAQVLLPLEFKCSFDRSATNATADEIAKDWMSYLFTHMLSGCHESADAFLSRNNVTFVTFNYDRTLEHFFTIRLENSYDLSTEQASEIVNRLRIIHVYGSLGAFSASLLSRRPTPFDPHEIKVAASSICLMNEDRQNESAVGAAVEAIAKAQRVCFLGFGFDPDNISRLQLPTCCHGKTVGATRFQVAQGDWSRTLTNMSPVSIGYQGQREWDCLAFLKESPFPLS